MANDTAYRSANAGAGESAAQDIARPAADHCASGSAFFLVGHACAAAQHDNGGQQQC